MSETPPVDHPSPVPPAEEHQGKVFYILTGLSGAGKSLVSQFLEDQGFYCVDNLPPQLIEKFIELTIQSRKTLRRILLVCDVRSGTQFKEFLETVAHLEKEGIRLVILFLEAKNEVLVRRFSETRRRHPLNSGSLIEDIQRERDLLADVRSRADLRIDTSALSVQQLKQKLQDLLTDDVSVERLVLVLTSFGFKHGIPVEADLVFDVRFLPNPHYIKTISHLTGRDTPVQEYVFSHPIAQDFYDRLLDMLRFLIPQYIQEGKSLLTIAVGCTGGQHRSVTMVERLLEDLRAQKVKLLTNHRDIEKRQLVLPL